MGQLMAQFMVQLLQTVVESLPIMNDIKNSRVFLCIFLLFVLTVMLWFQGWYIVTYALGIYILNLFIAFLTPKIDPAMHDQDGEYPAAYSCFYT